MNRFGRGCSCGACQSFLADENIQSPIWIGRNRWRSILLLSISPETFYWNCPQKVVFPIFKPVMALRFKYPRLLSSNLQILPNDCNVRCSIQLNYGERDCRWVLSWTSPDLLLGISNVFHNVLFECFFWIGLFSFFNFHCVSFVCTIWQ